MAINRTGKTSATPDSINEIASRPSAPNELKPNRNEIEKNKEDLTALNNDLKLLSTLLGRPISEKDIPQLTQTTATQQHRPPIESKITTTTERANKITPTNSAATTREIEFLETILQKQPTSPQSTSDLFLPGVEPADAYGKTNDALLATILKQRGIGPAHNNIPVDLFTSTTTTTQRPRQQYPVRSSRPILDGLSWLWRTWQDTRPGSNNPTSAATSSRTRTRGLMPTDAAPAPSSQNGHLTFDDGLDSDTSSVQILRSNNYNNNLSKILYLLYFFFRIIY